MTCAAPALLTAHLCFNSPCPNEQTCTKRYWVELDADWDYTSALNYSTWPAFFDKTVKMMEPGVCMRLALCAGVFLVDVYVCTI